MADTGEVKPDSEATKWFLLAMIGTVLYVGAAFLFVILADVEPGTDAVLIEGVEVDQATAEEAQAVDPPADREDPHEQ